MKSKDTPNQGDFKYPPNYIILKHSTTSELELVVNQKINEGYLIVGPAMKGSTSTNTPIFYQTMVLRSHFSA